MNDNQTHGQLLPLDDRTIYISREACETACRALQAENARLKAERDALAAALEAIAYGDERKWFTDRNIKITLPMEYETLVNLLAAQALKQCLVLARQH